MRRPFRHLLVQLDQFHILWELDFKLSHHRSPHPYQFEGYCRALSPTSHYPLPMASSLPFSFPYSYHFQRYCRCLSPSSRPPIILPNGFLPAIFLSVFTKRLSNDIVKIRLSVMPEFSHRHSRSTMAIIWRATVVPSPPLPSLPLPFNYGFLPAIYFSIFTERPNNDFVKPRLSVMPKISP